MDKLKKMPRFVMEIIFTAILYVALLILWSFVIKENVVISDQGLSTIGLALSTSLGALAAIVVSFVLITWQSSRRERSTSFWRWSDILHQLFNFYDARLELLWAIREDVGKLTQESAGAVLVTPMPRDKFKELVDKVFEKVTDLKETEQAIENPSEEEVMRQRAYVDITNYLVLLTTANLEHNLSHYLYRRVLSLRALLYRLLVMLIVSILIVAMGVTKTSVEISDIFNAPIAAVLIAWVIYVLILLGREIRRISLLEEEFRRQEDIQFPQTV